MNTKIFISLSTAAVIATSVFAYQGQGMSQNNMSQNNMPPQDRCAPMHKQKHPKMHHRHDRFFRALHAVKLTQDQREQIRTIFREKMKTRPNPYSAFSTKGFDEASFIKISNQMRNDKIKQKADVMKKIFNILTPAQKEVFVKQLKQRPPMIGKKGFQPRPMGGQPR